MSTLATTNIKHPSSASNNIVLDSSGGVDMDAFTVSGSAPADSVNLDASGRLLVGTSSAVGANKGRVQVKGASGGVDPFAKYVLVSANDEEAGHISLASSGSNAITISADPDNLRADSYLAFNVDATERMRIHQGGQIGFGSYTGTNPVGDNATAAWFNGPTGVGYLGAVSEASLYVNRKTTDGTIVDIRQDGTSEGTISVSGNTVSYNQFLGAHWAALADWSRPEIKIGTILESINELTDWKYAVIEVEGEQKRICYNGTDAAGSSVIVEYEGGEYEGIVELETNPEFNKAVKVKVNDIAASKAIYGVFVGWNNDSNGDGGVWNDMYVGAVGNYVIRMAEGQEPEIGDLVEADGTGCAVVQDDDIIRTKTVAKITSTIPQVTYDDGSFLVTCVLYCG
jgi:hypothetical protein